MNHVQDPVGSEPPAHPGIQSKDGGEVAIGLSGPGDLVTPLSQISLEEVSPSNEEFAACLKGQMA
jgi:hypothetical protein